MSFAPSSHLAVLPYSSGTTGNPKGVMLTHATWWPTWPRSARCTDMVADDVVLAVLPFFHIYGLTVLLNAALHARARLVIMRSFDLEISSRASRTTSAQSPSSLRPSPLRWPSIR